MSEASDRLDAEMIQRARKREWAAAGRPEQPSVEQLTWWMNEGGCEALDGCWVEPDGVCPHRFPSWLLHLGMI